MDLHLVSRLAFRAVLVWIVAGSLEISAKPQERAGKPGKAPQAVEKPSFFKADKDGILWFQKGTDGETKYSASLVLSAVTDGIVITVVANEKHIEDAVGLAKKMQTVLQKGKHTPDKIPIVAATDKVPGVGYRFYNDGLACGHETLGKKGIFTPSEAKKMLSRVAKHYRILREEYVATGKWGRDHAGWKALKIVGP